MYCHKYSIESKSLVSTNEAYFHAIKKSNRKKGMTTYAVRTKKLKDLQDLMKDLLRESIPDDFIKLLKSLIDTKFYAIVISTLYEMPHNNYIDSDTTNYIKNYEDCIARRIGIDDRNNIEFQAVKQYKPDSDIWTIVTEIKIYERDMYYRSHVLVTPCLKCNKDTHGTIDIENEMIYCSECNSPKFKINTADYLHTETSNINENRCPVCNGEICNDICNNCGINIEFYKEVKLFGK